MQSDAGSYQWTGEGTQTNAISVLDPESITGDPREYERNQGKNPNPNVNVDEIWTPEKIANTLNSATSDIKGYTDIAKKSDRRVLDFKPLFTADKMYDLNGIYMNNHEALNYMWGSAMSQINTNSSYVVDLQTSLAGASAFNVFGHIFGDTKTWGNQPNHDEAIVRGYLDNEKGVDNSANRDSEVQQQLKIHDTQINIKIGWKF